jgi:hypothetical protein
MAPSDRSAATALGGEALIETGAPDKDAEGKRARASLERQRKKDNRDLDGGHLILIALAKPRDSLPSTGRAWAACLTEPLPVTEYVLWGAVNDLSTPADFCLA